jgi:hypothetical protein
MSGEHDRHEPELVLAHLRSVEVVRDLARREAFVMAYSDCFYIMAVGLFASILALFFIPHPAHGGEPAG